MFNAFDEVRMQYSPRHSLVDMTIRPRGEVIGNARTKFFRNGRYNVDSQDFRYRYPLHRKASSDDFADHLSHEIDEKLAGLDEMERLPYDKRDIVQLIRTIETSKMKCLRGDITAKQLYRDADYSLSLFKIKHPGVDYLNDPALNAYFS